MMGRLPLLCLRCFDDTDAIGADKSVHTSAPSVYASPMHVHGNQAEQKKESLNSNKGTHSLSRTRFFNENSHLQLDSHPAPW